MSGKALAAGEIEWLGHLFGGSDLQVLRNKVFTTGPRLGLSGIYPEWHTHCGRVWHFTGIAIPER